MVDGMDGLMGKLDALGILESAVHEAVVHQTDKVRDEAQKLCKVYRGNIPGVISGALKDSIRIKVEATADKTVGTVYTNNGYAHYVEFGTGPVGQEKHEGISPHVPVAYGQDPWVWPDKEGGFHYTRGQPAKPFMYPALKSTEDLVVEGIKTDLQAAIRKACGK